MSAYVDREANPSEERRVDLHLADCGACRAQVRSLGRLKTAGWGRGLRGGVLLGAARQRSLP